MGLVARVRRLSRTVKKEPLSASQVSDVCGLQKNSGLFLGISMIRIVMWVRI